jgi:uncharacterized protein DUF5946
VRGITEGEAYNELQGYTLLLRDEAFIHQHVVDAWMAQHADETTKPIGLTFALIGLYLHVERGLSGRQVQQAHMTLGRRRRPWPRFPLPADRGSITAVDVIGAAPGAARNQAIDAWASSTWRAFEDSRPAVAGLVTEYGIDRWRPASIG